jgi:hypothetical protein
MGSTRTTRPGRTARPGSPGYLLPVELQRMKVGGVAGAQTAWTASVRGMATAGLSIGVLTLEHLRYF